MRKFQWYVFFFAPNWERFQGVSGFVLDFNPEMLNRARGTSKYSAGPKRGCLHVGAWNPQESVRSGKLQNESFPNFSNFRPEFCPEFCSEFSPNFSRSFRASFRGRRRPEKIHQKSPPFFNAKFPGKHEKNIPKFLLESKQSKKAAGKRQFPATQLLQCCMAVFHLLRRSLWSKWHPHCGKANVAVQLLQRSIPKLKRNFRFLSRTLKST